MEVDLPDPTATADETGMDVDSQSESEASAAKPVPVSKPAPVVQPAPRSPPVAQRPAVIPPAPVFTIKRPFVLKWTDDEPDAAPQGDISSAEPSQPLPVAGDVTNMLSSSPSFTPPAVPKAFPMPNMIPP
jgi:hypothetical protein